MHLVKRNYEQDANATLILVPTESVAFSAKTQGGRTTKAATSESPAPACSSIGRTVAEPLAKLLLAGAPLAMLAAITLAVIYAIGEYRQLQLLTIAQMVQWHGWLNAVGFIFCGLWGWRLLLDHKNQSRPKGLPAQWSQQ